MMPETATCRPWSRPAGLFLGLLLSCLLLACSPGGEAEISTLDGVSGQPTDSQSAEPSTDGAASVDAPAARALTPPEDSRHAVIVLGDSLTAGYGIRADEAYPALLQQKIDEAGFAYRVVNAGVSGDTSAGGKRRLDWAFQGNQVEVLIVALGGNDGLRGLSVDEMRANLSSILEEARRRDAQVLLTGMEAPPNNGPRYTAAFRSVFSDLARDYDVVFFPFLLQDVAGVSELNQRDGIHPNPEGAKILADNLWGYLLPMLQSPRNRSTAEPSTSVSSPASSNGLRP